MEVPFKRIQNRKIRIEEKLSKLKRKNKLFFFFKGFSLSFNQHSQKFLMNSIQISPLRNYIPFLSNPIPCQDRDFSKIKPMTWFTWSSKVCFWSLVITVFYIGLTEK
jgi:hypothetical protein